MEHWNASVPNMYVWEMLLDSNRTNAYIKYIKQHAKDKVIVDCGAGAGFFTWLSIKYGAKKVYSCEINFQSYNVLQNRFKDVNEIEVLNLDIFNDTLPIGDIYIHEIFGHCALTEGIAFFLANCEKQNISNVFPNNLKLISCKIEHLQQRPVTLENFDSSDLDEDLLEFFKLSNKKINPDRYLYNSDYTIVKDSEEVIFDNNIFDILKFDFKPTGTHTYFKAGFDDEYYSSFAKKQNQWEIRHQTTYPYLVYPAYARSILNRNLKTL
jgi:predicted RNA methylase